MKTRLTPILLFCILLTHGAYAEDTTDKPTAEQPAAEKPADEKPKPAKVGAEPDPFGANPALQPAKPEADAKPAPKPKPKPAAEEGATPEKAPNPFR